MLEDRVEYMSDATRGSVVIVEGDVEDAGVGSVAEFAGEDLEVLDVEVVGVDEWRCC